MSVRRPKHAGSWYSQSASELSNQLNSWLDNAAFVHGPARAIIAPHAGYRYSGPCAAHAYKQINPEKIKRIFVLGPSHHFGLSGCALSKVSTYKTPFYDLVIDTKVNDDLYATGYFDWLKIDVEEREHSIEMQLPFIAKVMENFQGEFTLVPILVGSIAHDKQALYAKLLDNYFKNPETIFVISSDFCHWGNQFRYTYVDTSFDHIYESIKNLDAQGMAAIENLDPKGFSEYLKKYSNTICGRHVIGILLNMAEKLESAHFKFLNYTQSNNCVAKSDSSVSYAAGALIVK